MGWEDEVLDLLQSKDEVYILLTESASGDLREDKPFDTLEVTL